MVRWINDKDGVVPGAGIKVWLQHSTQGWCAWAEAHGGDTVRSRVYTTERAARMAADSLVWRL